MHTSEIGNVRPSAHKRKTTTWKKHMNLSEGLASGVFENRLESRLDPRGFWDIAEKFTGSYWQLLHRRCDMNNPLNPRDGAPRPTDMLVKNNCVRRSTWRKQQQRLLFCATRVTITANCALPGQDSKSLSIIVAFKIIKDQRLRKPAERRRSICCKRNGSSPWRIQINVTTSCYTCIPSYKVKHDFCI